VKLSVEHLKQMEIDARKFSGAYTGTSGTLAGHVINLIKHVRRGRRPFSRLFSPSRRPILCRPMPRRCSICSSREGQKMNIEWKKTASELPPVGEDVLVCLRGECFDVYAVAHLEEDGTGDAYWDSTEDAICGTHADAVACWAVIPEAPKEFRNAR
jgi:hypothetical protein